MGSGHQVPCSLACLLFLNNRQSLGAVLGTCSPCPLLVEMQLGFASLGRAGTCGEL